MIHHEYCSDGYARLAQIIRKLNALKVALVWQSLAEVVKRGYRQKEISADCVEIGMYGAELQIENRSERRMSYLIRRREQRARQSRGHLLG